MGGVLTACGRKDIDNRQSRERGNKRGAPSSFEGREGDLFDLGNGADRRDSRIGKRVSRGGQKKGKVNQTKSGGLSCCHERRSGGVKGTGHSRRVSKQEKRRAGLRGSRKGPSKEYEGCGG